MKHVYQGRPDRLPFAVRFESAANALGVGQGPGKVPPAMNRAERRRWLSLATRAWRAVARRTA